MNNQPPKIASRFLEWYCPASLYESIAGDLTETFEEDLNCLGKQKARWKYTWNVIRFFRPEIVLRNKFRNHLFENSMLKNYLIIAFRSLWRTKAHTVINLFGLALGIACCVLISLYVRDEMTFDQFHSKADRIYRAYTREDWGENQQFFNTVTPFPMGPTLKENLKEIEDQVRISTLNAQVQVGENKFNETALIAGQHFFDVFDFEIVSGDPKALHGQSNVVLSERLATKYFGTVDPINKVLAIQMAEQVENFTVKAIAKDAPSNSSIQYDILISDLNYAKLYPRALNAWFNVFPETFVLLEKGALQSSVEEKFPSILRTAIGEEDFVKSKYKAGLQPLTDIHLNVNYPTGIAAVNNPKYAYILAGIAVLILFIACINFVTLSVGRSLKRAKEVGIRKVAGAVRTQLIMQFVGEAVLITLFALLLGVGLAVLSLPLFNELAGKQLVFPFNQFLFFIIGGLLLIVGLFSGSYPAFVLSSFKPISILKGSIEVGSSKQNVRKILVGVQLVLSVFLISSTLLMRNQLHFLQNKNMGFDKEQVVDIKLSVPCRRQSDCIKLGFEKAERCKIEMAKIPGVISVSASSHDFGNGNWTNIGYTDDKGAYRTFFLNVVDADYIPTMKMQLVAGRNFSPANLSDKRRSVIVNEAFVREYGWSEGLGMRIPGKKFQDHEIIGVLKDFNYQSLYTKVQPLIMVEDITMLIEGIENVNVDNSPTPKLLVRVKPENISNTLGNIAATWKKVTSDEEFTFSFVDQAMAKQYQKDQNLGRIVSIATFLAVIIGSLGLYALASLAIQNRTKEISIRKVMGASDNSLLYLLSREYLLLVIICLVISVPITWYLMSNWLSTFEYRVNIRVNIFIWAGAISLVIALATISFQLLKTVWTNPVKSLKYE